MVDIDEREFRDRPNAEIRLGKDKPAVGVISGDAVLITTGGSIVGWSFPGLLNDDIKASWDVRA